MRFYLSRGWNVLTFDLRGHGESVRQEIAHRPATAGHAGDAVGGRLAARRQGRARVRRPSAEGQPGQRAIVGLGLGADLAYAASARGWGAASVVCVSPDEVARPAFAGPGAFEPRGIYLMYGALDPNGNTPRSTWPQRRLFPAECDAYQGECLTGIHLWDERQPEIVARSIAWIERTI